MTILECIARIDHVKPNTYSKSEKISWLSTIDGLVKKGVIDRYKGGENVSFCGYDENTPQDTELLVPAPFDEIYLFGIAARIDYWNGENDKYNDNTEMFNNMYAEYAKWYNKTHKAFTGKRFIF